MRVNASAAPGLAPMRRYVAHHCRNCASSLRLGARLRQAGYAVELTDVLRSPTLGDLAARLQLEPSAPSDPSSAVPFSLLTPQDLAVIKTLNG